MKEIILLIAKNGVQIGLFLYFHRDNSFDTISSINFMTFFLILISYFFRKNFSRAFSSQMFDFEMLLRIVLAVIATLVNQTLFVYNLITYSFLMHDLGDHVFTICEFYYKRSKDQDLSMIPNYQSGFLSIVQIIIAFVVFIKDVGMKDLFLALILVFLEISSKLARIQLLSHTRIDIKAFDSVTIGLCFCVHLITTIFKKVFSFGASAELEPPPSENPFQDIAHFTIFMAISIAFSYFTNEGLKGQLHLQKRQRFQSIILWLLLVFNKLAVESKDMKWNSLSLILIYGILAICELINMESPKATHLIIVSSEENGSDVIASASNMHKIETYDQVSLKNFVKHLKRNQDSKKLIFMLLFNFSFMFVELIYGLLSNSLSLISDSAHMLFDSSALAIGLYAAFMSKLKPSPTYSFGFERFSTLSGFMNGLFLVFVAFDIFTESIERMYSPQEVLSEKMMIVSIIGLIINLVGLCFFHEHAHVHEEGSSCPHSHAKHDNHSHELQHVHNHENHDHGHSNETDSLKCNHDHDHSSHHHDHDHSHDNHDHDHHDHDHSDHHHDHDKCSSHDHHQKQETHSHDHNDDKGHDHHTHNHGESGQNENLTGVYLHILADALGSVGVIISSVLIYYYGWYISDPITSFIISIFIFISVFPLLKQSLSTLLQSYNIKKHHSTLEIFFFIKAMNFMFHLQLSSHKEIERYSEVHLWAYTTNTLVFTVKVHARDQRKRFKLLKEIKKTIKQYSSIKYFSIEVICDLKLELESMSAGEPAVSETTEISLNTAQPPNFLEAKPILDSEDLDEDDKQYDFDNEEMMMI